MLNRGLIPMHPNACISGCGSAWALKLCWVIIVEKVLAQLAKRNVVVIEDVFAHGKELNVFINNIAGVEVNNGISRDLWAGVGVITP